MSNKYANQNAIFLNFNLKASIGSYRKFNHIKFLKFLIYSAEIKSADD